jgi:hypothetical protein
LIGVQIEAPPLHLEVGVLRVPRLQLFVSLVGVSVATRLMKGFSLLESLREQRGGKYGGNGQKP